tara:strand:- start:6034 stop:6210 length:177 start_codon:yes stop_codon:yes gene_type:complete
LIVTGIPYHASSSFTYTGHKSSIPPKDVRNKETNTEAIAFVMPFAQLTPEATGRQNNT